MYTLSCNYAYDWAGLESLPPLSDDTWGEVKLMCGLPGTGKDAWIQAHHPDLPVVSLHGLRRALETEPTDNQGRVVQAARERAKALLREKRPFVWNAISLTSLRAQQIDLFGRYHARVRVVVPGNRVGGEPSPKRKPPGRRAGGRDRPHAGATGAARAV